MESGVIKKKKKPYLSDAFIWIGDRIVKNEQVHNSEIISREQDTRKTS